MGRDEAYRVQLEGGAETLEVAAVRYRALNGMLDSLGWRERVAENDDLVAALIKDHEALQLALGRARRLLENAPSPALKKLVGRVEELLSKADALLGRRARVSGALVRGLEALRSEVAPTPEGDAKLWRTARAQLPLSDRMVETLPQFTERVRELAVRPPPPKGRALPWNEAEVTELLEAAAALDAGCAALWRKVSADVERLLLVRVMSALKAGALPDDGPSRLIRAEGVRRLVHARIAELLGAAFSPLKPQPHEATVLLSWLVKAQGEPPLQPPERAALFALAAKLASGPARSEQEWSALDVLAQQADGTSAEAKALLDNLGLFLRIKEQQQGRPSSGKPRPLPSTLSESLLRLRALSSSRS